MKDKLNVEVEGEELLLQSDNGSYAIIPKKNKARVMYYLKNDKQDRLNKLISKLPRHTDYAENGSLLIPEKKSVTEMLLNPNFNKFANQTTKPNTTTDNTSKTPFVVRDIDPIAANINVPVDNAKIESKTSLLNLDKETVKAQESYRQNAAKLAAKEKPVSLNSVSNLESLDSEKVKEIQKELVEKGYLGSTKISVDKSNKADVKFVQELLESKGYDLGKYGVDGIYGKFTDAAFKKFNKDTSASIDGIVGPKTKEAFKNYQLDKKKFESKLTVDLTGKGEKEIQEALFKQNYFKNKKEDFDFNTENIMLTSEKSGFKPTSETVCTSTQCTTFVGQEIEKVVKEKGREKIDAYGDAWTIRDRLVNKGAESIYNVFPKEKPKVSNPDKYIEEITRNKPDLKQDDFKSGDIVNLYYGGSDYAKKAYEKGGSVFSTHTGIIKIDNNGNKFIEHNVGGKIKREPLSIFLENNAKTVTGKPLRITAVTRPNYGIREYEDVYEPTETAINFDIVTNVKTPLGKKESAQFTQVLINNKDRIINDIPINESEFNKLIRATRILGWKESGFQANPKSKAKDVGSNVREGLGIREASTGYTQLKDEENFSPAIRERLGINNESLKDPKVSAIATMYALSTKYLKIKSSLKDKNFTEDELAQLALISWNEPVEMVIKTAEKYKTLDKVRKAYQDSYGYDKKGNTLFPYDLALEGYNKYLK